MSKAYRHVTKQLPSEGLPVLVSTIQDEKYIAYFDGDDNEIKVVTFKNDEFNYDKIRFTNKKYFYVNWEMQEAKTIDNPYEFFAEDNGFSKDDITMFQEMYVGQRKVVDDMMFDVEILRVK